MSDQSASNLREKIVKILEDWQELIDVRAQSYELGSWEKDPDPPETITERILALLPKMPELRWDGNSLCLGNLNMSYNDASIQENGDGFTGWLGDEVVGHVTEQEARAAVENAVRKALGWEE